MAEQRTHYRIFVASPGDVARERQVAREVTLSLSHRLGSHGGFTLEPVGWETQASLDAGRPQSLINPLVRECDVFVGILWSRFGTETGVAESGTAEEFTEAERVRQQSGERPTMLVFFSDAPVSMEHLRDSEGRRQFDRTLEFRERYEKSGGLAQRYKDIHEFERKLREQLESWCGTRFAAEPGVSPAADTSALHREYLQLLFNTHRDLPVSGFETNLRIPIDLESVCVPLRVRIAALDRERTDLAAEHALQPAEGVRDFAGAWEFAAQRDIRLVVVLGQPGSGKTTLLKQLALVCASGKAGELGLTADTVPIFVPLRHLTMTADFATVLQAASDLPLRGYPPNFFASALGEGRCLLLLDGLDEVADRAAREQVSRWIEKLAARYPRNRIVVTARFAGYRDAPLQMGHLELSIERLGDNEIESFLQRWYRAVQTQLYGDSPESAQRAEELAARLVEAILAHDEIRVLATNPLMLQIIALVHRDRGALPSRRVELFEECTNVLLERWDRAKGLDAGLTAREARQVLQPLALWMHGEINRIRATEGDILPVIAGPLARLAGPLDASEFLRSVRDRSGLLVGFGVDEYGFLHRSFQEYLAAEEIHSAHRFDTLVEHYDESWWREVTRLFVGLGNPNQFDDFMREVARTGKLAGHESFTAECVRDALLPSAEPFLEVTFARQRWWDRVRKFLSREAGSAQRYAALLAMRALPSGELARVAERLATAARDPDAVVRRVAGELLAASGRYGAEALSAGIDPDSGLPRARINPVDGTEMVLIPAGPFKAGSSQVDENPPRGMELTAFYLARYPVTNGQYRQFLEANEGVEKPRSWDDERYNQPLQPVVMVSWQDATAYCKWAGLRLPTEWEWEKGARGTEGRGYPWGEEKPGETRANFGENVGEPTPVGSYPRGASPYGVLDMAGNVSEWTASRHEKGGDARVVRGGSFAAPPGMLRAASRSYYQSDFRSPYSGFRCAQDYSSFSPLAVARQFFANASFEKPEELSPSALLLRVKGAGSPRLAVLWNADLRRTAEEVDRHRDRVREFGTIYLVYTEAPPPTEAIQKLHVDLKCEIVPIASAWLEGAISEGDCSIRLRDVEIPYLTRQDPYDESKPIGDPTWFFGRSRLLETLPAMLSQGQHVGIFGIRKVGKTSLVKQLRLRLQGTPSVWIDCQAHERVAEEFFGAILHELHIALRSMQVSELPAVSGQRVSVGDFTLAIKATHARWRESGGAAPFILIFDEIDKLFPDRRLEDSDRRLTEYVGLFGALRGMAQVHDCLACLVLACRPDVNRQNQLSERIGENPMFESFHEVFLGFLTDEESERMIHEIGAWRNIKWEAEAAQEVFYYCGGHPLITRYFASYACEAGTRKSIDLARVEESAKEIRAALRRNEIGNYYKESVWMVLREDERELLATLSREGRQSLPESDVPGKLQDALTHLEQFGLVKLASGRVAVTSQILYEWLRRMPP